MSETAQINPKGLFGGLLKELRVDSYGLLAEVNATWNCQDVEAVSDLCDWRRGGAETYVAEGELKFAGGRKCRIIAKAFVRWGPSPIEQQRIWELRRSELLMAGVRAPKIYARYAAMIVEEYIPDPLPDPELLDPKEAFQLGQIAHVLLQLKFSPISLVADIRVLNRTLFLVDFGSDLGSSDRISSRWVEELRKRLPSSARTEFDHGLEVGLKRS